LAICSMWKSNARDAAESTSSQDPTAASTDAWDPPSFLSEIAAYLRAGLSLLYLVRH